MGREIIRVAEQLLDDPEIRLRIRLLVGLSLRQNFPALVDRLTPELVDVLSQASREGVTKENVIQFVERILAPW
ncbi:MAG: hypothetical protein NZ899_04370 [Thermoguttaceae bacterium]|nr:hypothetical protein [Thermoguttaceae bacterium]MDW8077630.1 hypothetical protein [Thermoguttaceae bacterium]